MSRYYFHIRDGWDVIPDEEGMELPDFGAAHTEAYASAYDLSRAAAREGTNVSSCAIQIMDEAGNVLARVRVPDQKRLA